MPSAATEHAARGAEHSPPDAEHLAGSAERRRRTRLAVVIPVYRNEQTLETLYERLLAAAAELPCELTLVLVNDRSPDNAQAVIESLVARDPRVRGLLLSRNFGSFVAIQAGLNEVTDHDAVVIMAADLQDPPEILPELYGQWEAGKPVVICRRRRRSDPWATRLFSRAFNAVFRRIALPEMPVGGFDFCLVDRRVVEVLARANEKRSSLVGLIIWCGFDRALVDYDRAERADGEKSGWTLRRKLVYAIDSIVSFSTFPLRIFSLFGFGLALLCLLAVAFYIVFYRQVGASVPGWTAQMVVSLFIGSGLFVGLGITGEYLANLLDQSRQRPLYVVDRRVGGRLPDPANSPSLAREGASTAPKTLAAASEPVPMFDAAAQSIGILSLLEREAAAAITAPQQILGPQVEAFETALAGQLEGGHVVGVANGTDALTLALWASDVPSGAVVICPALTAPATAVAILRAGCRPCLVDVDPEQLLLDPQRVREAAAQHAASAVVPVHLYGNPVDMERLAELARELNLTLIEDCAQAFGSRWADRPVGTFSSAAAFSFYPTKNLGGYGDGGAVWTGSAERAERLRQLRFYGQDSSGELVQLGINSRLDELQARLLRQRLLVSAAQAEQRRALARFYQERLGPLRPVPNLPGQAPHLFVVRVRDRERFRRELSLAGIATGVHYPRELTAHRLLRAEAICCPTPVAAQAAAQVVSLPLYAGLSFAQAERVVAAALRYGKDA